MEEKTLMGKTALEAMSVMSWEKNKSMYKVICRNILGPKGDAFWGSMNRRQERLKATLRQG